MQADSWLLIMRDQVKDQRTSSLIELNCCPNEKTSVSSLQNNTE